MEFCQHETTYENTTYRTSRARSSLSDLLHDGGTGADDDDHDAYHRVCCDSDADHHQHHRDAPKHRRRLLARIQIASVKGDACVGVPLFCGALEAALIPGMNKATGMRVRQPAATPFLLLSPD